MTIREFAQIQRQIVFRDFVIRPHDAAPEQAPERFDGLRMNFTANELIVLVRDEIMLEAHPIQMPIAVTLIGRNQIDSARNSLADEIIVGAEIRILDHLTDHVTFAGDGPDYFGLPSDAALSGQLPFALVPIPLQTAKIDFIDLDHAHQLFPLGIFHRGAQSHALIPSRVVIVQVLRSVHHAMQLKRADALFRDQHQEADLEPRPKRTLGILEDRVCDHGESVTVFLVAYDRLASVRIVAGLAALADPLERARFEFVHVLVAASRAAHAIGPAHLFEILLANIIAREPFVESI